MIRHALLLLCLALAGCKSSPGVGPEDDAFAAWDAMGVVVAGDRGSSSPEEAMERYQAWLNSPADWRSFDAERFEAAVLYHVDRMRADAGRKPLQWDPQVAAVARAHSLEMAVTRTLSHTAPAGLPLSPAERLTLAGLPTEEASEAITMVSTDRRRTWGWLAKAVVARWTEGEDYEALTLHRRPHAGVGAALDTSGEPAHIYLTLDLVNLRR